MSTAEPLGKPTLQDLKEWLGLTDPADTADDVVLQQALDSALVSQARTVCYPVDGFGDQVFTDDLVTAVFLRATRIASRRNSPEAVIGLQGTDGDFVGARVPGVDPDVARLEGSYVRIVSA